MNPANACPSPDVLERFLGLDLSPGAERAVREHLADCAVCAEISLREDPLRIFLAAPRLTLPGPAWDDVLCRVRAEVEAAPRRRRLLDRFLDGQRAWPAVPRLAGVFAAALALVLLSLPPLAPGDAARPRHVQWHRPGADKPGMAAGFVYLSNPAAEVTHVLVTGAGDEAAIELTMIVDENLDDLF
jgi:hypothetical protein